MNSFVVETPAQLSAALLAAAEDTYEAARDNPFQIRFGTAKYTFREGLHRFRAAHIALAARKMYRVK